MNDPSLTLPLVDATARTLLHVIWQAGAVAAILVVGLRVLRGRTAESRYFAAVLALAVIAVAAAITFTTELSERTAGAETLPPHDEMAALQRETLGEVALAGLMDAAVDREERAELVALAQRLAPGVVALWFAGVFVFSLRLAIGCGRVAQMVREARSELDSEWSDALRRLSGRLGLTRGVRLLHSTRVEVPTVIGWFRPVILVPLSALTGLEPKQIETILAHELAHVRRHDYAVNLFQSVVETLFFYHPAVWWISRQIRIEREHCCDDLAIAVCGDPLLYATALTELEELRVVAQPSVAANGGSLLSRIRRIAGRDETTHVHPGWIAALSMTTLLAAATIAAPVRPDDSWRSNGPALFWPGDSAAGTLAATLVGSRSASQHEPAEPIEPQGWLQLDPIEPLVVIDPIDPVNPVGAAAPATAIESSIRTAFVVAEEAIRATSSTFGSSFAYVIADAVHASNAMVAQGETVTVTEERSREERDADDALTVDDLIQLRSVGIEGKYVSEMRQLGYDLTLGELYGLRAVGVTPDYVRSLAAAGYTGLEREELQSLAAVGVTKEYISELGRLGIRNLDADELMSARAVGVSPAYIAEMRALFDEELGIDELVQMRAVGVSSQFAASMKAAGYGTLDAERLVELRAVGVNADYIAALRGAGYADASLDEIVAARSVGVSIEYLGDLARFGIRNLDLDEVISLRAVGVSPAWIQGMAAAGYEDLDADEMTQLRAIGVTPEYVQELRDAGLVNLTADELTQLRSSGIDASFIREMRDGRKR